MLKQISTKREHLTLSSYEQSKRVNAPVSLMPRQLPKAGLIAYVEQKQLSEQSYLLLSYTSMHCTYSHAGKYKVFFNIVPCDVHDFMTAIHFTARVTKNQLNSGGKFNSVLRQLSYLLHNTQYEPVVDEKNLYISQALGMQATRVIAKINRAQAAVSSNWIEKMRHG